MLRVALRVVVIGFKVWFGCSASAELGECRVCVVRGCFRHVDVLLRKVDGSFDVAGACYQLGVLVVSCFGHQWKSLGCSERKEEV